MSKRSDYDMPGGAQPAPEENKGAQGWVPDEDPLVELARIVGETTTRYRPSSRLEDETPDPVLPSPPAPEAPRVSEEAPQKHDPFAALDEAFRNMGEATRGSAPTADAPSPEWTPTPERPYDTPNKRVTPEVPVEPVMEQPSAPARAERKAAPFVPPVEDGEPFNPETFVPEGGFDAPSIDEPKRAAEAPSVELGQEEAVRPSAPELGRVSNPAHEPAPSVDPAPMSEPKNYAAFTPEEFRVDPAEFSGSQAEVPSEPNFDGPSSKQIPDMPKDELRPSYAPEPEVAPARTHEPNFDFESSLTDDLEASLAASLNQSRSAPAETEWAVPPIPPVAPSPAAPDISSVPRNAVPGAGAAAGSRDVKGAYDLGSGVDPSARVPAAKAPAFEPKASSYVPQGGVGHQARTEAVQAAEPITHDDPTPAPSSGFMPDLTQFELDTMGANAEPPAPSETAAYEDPFTKSAPQSSLDSFEADLLAELNSRHADRAPSDPSVEPSAVSAVSQPDMPAASPAESVSEPSFEDELIASMNHTALRGANEPGSDDDLFAAGSPNGELPGYTQHRGASLENDIDEMSWPAAAERLAQQAYTDEDEDYTPPPQGYDLDAVAQAMRAEDPSLNGEGILPAGTAAYSAPEELEEAAYKDNRVFGVKRGVLAAACIGAVLVVGGAGYFVLGLGSDAISDAEPRLIVADNSPMKEFPNPEDQPSQKSSARILMPSDDAAAPEGERMLPRDTARVDPLPPAPDAEAESNAMMVNAPKRVRTVVVRPDGTIVSADSSSEGADASGDRLLSEQQTASLSNQNGFGSDAGSQPPVGTFGGDANGAASVETSTLRPAQNGSATATPPANPETGAEQTPEAVVDVTPKQKPDAPAGFNVASNSSANSSSSGPLVLTPNAAAPATPSQPATSSAGTIPSGTYVVQVSSVRSEQEAQGEIRALSNRFPTLMSGVDPVVVRADLGDRGIFYRVRIPFSGSTSANQFCTDLKNAGGDCFVRRN
ncbi:SPOR domain-containing protein [Pseudovibrio exalbescens]|uniref:SPOR domain-containing protein n=1 Tax=Pseudovibrio exalbescens TaxID=197461 RepID=UPI000C9B8622|nr:SPOR domain-containing protein [Pseudovibrio exalbescens]